MKKLGVFFALTGVAYLIYGIFVYIDGVKSLTSLVFAILLSVYFIVTGLDKIFSWQQNRPTLFKYISIGYIVAAVLVFIWALIVG